MARRHTLVLEMMQADPDRHFGLAAILGVLPKQSFVSDVLGVLARLEADGLIESIDDGVYYRLARQSSDHSLVAVAHYLRMLADAVERDKILEFEVKWDGGDNVDSNMKMVNPLEFAIIQFEVKNEGATA